MAGPLAASRISRRTATSPRHPRGPCGCGTTPGCSGCSPATGRGGGHAAGGLRPGDRRRPRRRRRLDVARGLRQRDSGWGAAGQVQHPWPGLGPAPLRSVATAGPPATSPGSNPSGAPFAMAAGSGSITSWGCFVSSGFPRASPPPKAPTCATPTTICSTSWPWRLIGRAPTWSARISAPSSLRCAGSWPGRDVMSYRVWWFEDDDPAQMAGPGHGGGHDSRPADCGRGAAGLGPGGAAPARAGPQRGGGRCSCEPSSDAGSGRCRDACRDGDRACLRRPGPGAVPAADGQSRGRPGPGGAAEHAGHRRRVAELAAGAAHAVGGPRAAGTAEGHRRQPEPASLCSRRRCTRRRIRGAWISPCNPRFRPCWRSWPGSCRWATSATNRSGTAFDASSSATATRSSSAVATSGPLPATFLTSSMRCGPSCPSVAWSMAKWSSPATTAWTLTRCPSASTRLHLG